NACMKEILYTMQKMETDKLLSMDFQAADDPGTHQRLTYLAENCNWNGHGLPSPLYHGANLVKHLFVAASAVALTVTLFTRQVPLSAGAWTLLNAPLLTLGALAVLLGITFLAPWCQNKCNQFFVRITQQARDANRSFTFCFGSVPAPERAADVRMYSQEKLVNHYWENKTFLPGGPLARCAKGPMGLWTG